MLAIGTESVVGSASVGPAVFWSTTAGLDWLSSTGTRGAGCEGIGGGADVAARVA